MADEKVTLTEKRFFKWYVDDISVSLRAKSGSYGGGSEVLVIMSAPTPSVLSAPQTTKESETK